MRQYFQKNTVSIDSILENAVKRQQNDSILLRLTGKGS